MDGTLVDSHEVIRRTWQWWSAKHGVPLEPIMAVEKGRPNREVMAQFAPPDLDLDGEVAEFLERETRDISGLVAVPGAYAAVEAAQSGKWGVVTSAERTLAAARLRAVGFPVPEALVGADDVQHGKPDPECYLLGAKELGLDPADCLVFEDAPAGVLSAAAAGTLVVGVCTTFRPEDIPAPYHVNDFRSVTIRNTAQGFEVLLNL